VLANTPNTVGDDTCIECHTTLGGTRLPYGQLDLTRDPNQNPNEFPRPYLELFTEDEGQIFAGGALVSFPIPVQIRPTMTVNGARSSYFVEKMTGTELDDNSRSINGYDHTSMLSDAELKLISEWIDLGAQIFNNPFDDGVPQN
jgi:hypothetical protein